MGAGQSVQPPSSSRVTGVVFVTADWCGACKREKPHWDAFVKQEKGSSSQVKYRQIRLGTPAFQTYRTRIEAFPTYFLTHEDGSETTVVGSRGSEERYREMVYQ